MRCPYCGGINPDHVSFCAKCGRDLRRPPSNTQPQQPGYAAPPANNPPANRGSNPSGQQQRSNPSGQQQRSNPQARTHQQTPPQPALAGNRQPNIADRAPASVQQAVLLPPGPFPPRTMAQFEALLATGCHEYTLAESRVENGKKIVSIVYPRCENWRQAATLLRALRQNQEEKYQTIIVRGLYSQWQELFAFTNGQLQFDRDVRLGSRIENRYVLETGNGYANDAIRFVLNV